MKAAIAICLLGFMFLISEVQSDDIPAADAILSADDSTISKNNRGYGHNEDSGSHEHAQNGDVGSHEHGDDSDEGDDDDDDSGEWECEEDDNESDSHEHN